MACQRDRPPDVLDGRLVLTRLMRRYAEQVNRFGLIRIDSQNLPINLLGSRESSRLMMLDGDR